jgi:hypothetical protein
VTGKAVLGRVMSDSAIRFADTLVCEADSGSQGYGSYSELQCSGIPHDELCPWYGMVQDQKVTQDDHFDSIKTHFHVMDTPLVQSLRH